MQRRTISAGSRMAAGALALVAVAVAVATPTGTPTPTGTSTGMRTAEPTPGETGGATDASDARPATGAISTRVPSGPSIRVLPGVTRPGREVTISAPFDGVLMNLHVTEGSLVKAGDVLAALDDRVARAAVAAARAEAAADARITHAALELELAERLLARTRVSHEADGASEREVDDATLRRDQASASLASARFARAVDAANLALEEARLDGHVIRAPFAGIVTRISTDVGATLTGSAEILHLVALDTLRADQYLPAELYGAMELGRDYTLEASAPVGRTVTATLRFVEPVIDAATGTFRCVFDVPNPERTMPAGITVRLVPDELTRLVDRSARTVPGDSLRAASASTATSVRAATSEGG